MAAILGIEGERCSGAGFGRAPGFRRGLGRFLGRCVSILAAPVP